MKPTQPVLDYLATCSERSLQAFELARLNEAANLRQDLMQQISAAIEQIVEADSQARLARWVQNLRQVARRPAGLRGRRGENSETQQALAFHPTTKIASSQPPPPRHNRLLQLSKSPRRSRIARPATQLKLASAG